MCSVDGFTGKQPFTLEQYASINQDRGPDCTNYWSDGRVHIAHSLLKIQENPSNLAQPLERNGKVLSYNGEIYGIDGFDTEYLFNLLDQGDWTTIKYQMNGMWAFSFYDSQNETITLCRDHFGVKPLYYMVINGEIFWSSTPKTLIATLKALEYEVEQEEYYENFDIFTDAFWLSPYTRFRYIKRLGPGQIVNWSVKHRKILTYDTIWGADFSLAPNLLYDPDEYKELAERCIREACTAPNVRKCISLSGGLDSTLIASLNKHQDNLFCSTVEFERYVDDDTKIELIQESVSAEKTAKALNLEITKKLIDRNYTQHLSEVNERLGDSMWISSRTVPRLENIRNAKAHGAKIYITGDLADELVTGYGGHSWYFNMKEFTNEVWDPINEKHCELPFHVVHPTICDERTFLDYVHRHNASEVLQWFPVHAFGMDLINNNLFIKLLSSTDSFCGLTDGLAGSFGMESRVPFLHQELAKYILTIPSAHKLRFPWNREKRDKLTVATGQSRRAGRYKWLIREELREHIPPHVLYDFNKVGFSTPWKSRGYYDNVKKRVKENKNTFDLLKDRFTFPE
jgi:asparagine synthase (glutamine-hydrolysing)